MRRLDGPSAAGLVDKASALSFRTALLEVRCCSIMAASARAFKPFASLFRSVATLRRLLASAKMLLRYSWDAFFSRRI